MKRLKKIARLPIIQDYYNDEERLNYDYVDIGLQIVDVNKIIGLTDSRVDEYNDDWTPKNENDSRWIYQKKLIENGEQMQPIPLILMPNGYYITNGDGNHRVSIAHVLNLSTIKANVLKMIPKSEKIDNKWKEYAKEQIEELNLKLKEYNDLLKQLPKIQDEAFETGDETKEKEFMEKLNKLSEEISELNEKLIKEEKNFKHNLLN